MADPVTHKKIKLPVEVKKQLEDFSPLLTESKEALETLKRLGMDTTEIQERLDWAANVQKVLLSEFSG